MTSAMRKVATEVGWRLPFYPERSNHQPVVLMYHGVPRKHDQFGLNGEVFESHVKFLKRHFDPIGPDTLPPNGPDGGRTKVLLTFDDGFRNNVEVVAEILRNYEVPALFFVSCRHLEPGRYMWFTYLRALGECYRGDGFRFNGQWLDMSGERRGATIAVLRYHLLGLKPHPSAMYKAIENELPRIEDFTPDSDLMDRYAGMTQTQLRSLAADPLFTIGGHTVDHPFLTKCEPDEAARQIGEGKVKLEEVSGKACEFFAYPADDYNQSVLVQCRDAGFKGCFSVHRQIQADRQYQLPRTGIYYPQLSELGFKVRWAGVLGQIQRRRMNECT